VLPESNKSHPPTIVSHRHPRRSRPSLSSSLPFPLRFCRLSRASLFESAPWGLSAEPPPRCSLPYSSGSSANGMCLLVERVLDAELPLAPVLRLGSRKPLDGGGLCGVHRPPLSADGYGSRLDDPECMYTGLVKRRETLAVVVDVLRIGAGRGDRRGDQGRTVRRRHACRSDSKICTQPGWRLWQIRR
jgi:hypothetical protein